MMMTMTTTVVMTMSDQDEHPQVPAVHIVLDDPQMDRYIIKTLVAGCDDELETALLKGMNGFDPDRYQEALRAIHSAWTEERGLDGDDE